MGQSGHQQGLPPDNLFGRNLEFADSGLDLTDKDWHLLGEKGDKIPVKAGFPLQSQGHAAGVYHYTLDFGVDNLSRENDLFLLELGPVYQADETRVNGHLAGGFGTFPPPFWQANRVQQISRRYVVPGEWLNWEGPNKLEVKVDTGTIGGTIWYEGGGIFQGPVTLTPLRQRVLVDYALRDPSLSSVTPLLSDAVHLNRFLENNKLNLRIRLAHLSPITEITDMTVEVRMMNNGPAVSRRVTGFGTNEWSEWISLQLPMPGPGQYDCEVVVRSGEEVLYQRFLAFQVEEKLPALNVSAGLSMSEVPDSLVWQDVSSRTVGSFGARASNDKGVLDPNAWKQDVRGTLTTVLRFDRDSPRPMLLFPGIQEPPLAPFSPADYQEFRLGREYDGFADVWPFGFIRLGPEMDGEASLRFANWVSRGYELKGKSGSELGEIIISKLSPAFRLDAKTEYVIFFEELDLWGLEGPSQVAFEGLDGVRVLGRGDRFNGIDMAENWILVWFHGAEGWEDFDIPWLFVLEQVPGDVVISSSGLSMQPNEDGSSGVIYGMPLYGVRLLEPDITKDWKNGLHDDVLKHIRIWLQTLPAYPIGLDRSVAVDWEAGDVYVRERMRSLLAKSDQAREMIPVPPVMALGMCSDNLQITVNENVEDTALVTAYGPFLVARDSNELIYRIPDLLQFVREAPQLVDDAPQNDDYNQTRRILQETLKDIIVESRLDLHPWPDSIWREKFTPGYRASRFSFILASLPYLQEPLSTTLEGHILDEVNKVFLSRQLEPDARSVGGWNPDYDADLYQDIFDPITGQNLTVLHEHVDRRAIDTPFWQSYQIYNIWQAAHYLDNWHRTEQAWPHVTDIAELPLHSHDWAILQSWDFFSGYRIGNGLQETGGIYAGYVAMARMAHHFGYEDERDLRAGLAVLHLVALDVANTGIQYMRLHRPWSGHNSTAAEVARAEKMFPTRYIEYNEYTGSPVQAILLPLWPLFYSSYIHDLIPDVMRVYPEIWPNENEAFFQRASFDPPLDMAIRMQRADESRIEALYHRQVASPKHYERIMAARGFLEFAGAMGWEEVIASPMNPANRENNEKEE